MSNESPRSTLPKPGDIYTMNQARAAGVEEKRTQDVYEYKLRTYAHLSSGDGLKPLRTRPLSELSRDELERLLVFERDCHRARVHFQAQDIRFCQAALTKRNARVRELYSELRQLRMVWRYLDAADTAAGNAKITGFLREKSELLSAFVAQGRELDEARADLARLQDEYASSQRKLVEQGVAHQRDRDQLQAPSAEVMASRDYWQKRAEQAESDLEQLRRAQHPPYQRGFDDGKASALEGLADWLKDEHGPVVTPSHAIPSPYQRGFIDGKARAIELVAETLKGETACVEAERAQIGDTRVLFGSGEPRQYVSADEFLRGKPVLSDE